MCDRVVVIGLDGMEPSIVERMLADGELPNLARMRQAGGYARMATTLPAQTPVAWSSFAVGANPGAHGIFDFLARDPATRRPDVGLYRYEQKSRFLPPRAVNLRGGTPLWDRLGDAGVPSTVIRHPCTYPPDPLRGRMLSGVGVPDVRGGFGSPSFFTDEPGVLAREGEHVEIVSTPGDDPVAIHLRGPVGPRGADTTVEFRVSGAGPAGRVVVWSEGVGPVHLAEGGWSGWIPVRFRLGALQKVHGQVRFHLVSAQPFRLYASPVHFDPDMPLFPISHPWDYASELRRTLGPYHTLGMAEEHTGLNNGRISEQAFLSQCDDVMRERRAMMHHELARLDKGFLFCLFDTPDRIQHMFWRFRDPTHPSHRGETPPPELGRVVEDHYRVCDSIVGEALEHAGADTLVMVASDHGFTDFRRAVHINRWLHANGFLALEEGCRPGDEAGDLLEHVDWARTRAYGVGLAGIYVNLRGREAGGTVAPSEIESLKGELCQALTGLGDPELDRVAIRRVQARESVYTGEHVGRAPDLLVSCAPGYRISSASAMGGVPEPLMEDNRERWSGDHVVDPDAVPGVLFMNRPFGGERPAIIDLAPTVLSALGVPVPSTMEGASLHG